LFFFFYYVLKFLVFLIRLFRIIEQIKPNQQYENPQNPPPQQEGKVTLEKTKSSTKTKSDNVGDYVDFEEVEE
jgi:hypothetical protein